VSANSWRERRVHRRIAGVDTSALERYGSCTLEQDGCTTCSDAAVPARVLRLDGDTAQVIDRIGNIAAVATDFVPGVRTGDIVMVHLGVAIGMADETR